MIFVWVCMEGGDVCQAFGGPKGRELAQAWCEDAPFGMEQDSVHDSAASYRARYRRRHTHGERVTWGPVWTREAVRMAVEYGP